MSKKNLNLVHVVSTFLSSTGRKKLIWPNIPNSPMATAYPASLPSDPGAHPPTSLSSTGPKKLEAWVRRKMDTNPVDLEQILNDPLLDACRKLWAMFITLAIKDGATEFRYEPWRKKGTLRIAIQGKEYEMVPPPSSLAAEMVKAIYQMSVPDLNETWRTRLARSLRRWANSLDPPIYRNSLEYQLNLTSGTRVSVRTNPAGDAHQWIGVVLRSRRRL
jgi:hypothetical protein